MLDYVNRLQLAVKDTARRSVMKVVAGVILGIAAGFLMAALWSFLAVNLGWGSMLASLTIGGGLALIALIFLAVANRRKHTMPTTDDLKREVEARVSLATDAAVNRARTEAARVVDMAGNRAQSLMDEAGYRANKLAGDTERRVFGMARDAARTVGLTSDNIASLQSGARDATDTAKRAADSNVGSMAKLIGAFAVGVTLAAKVQESRRSSRAFEFDEDDLL